MDQIELESRAKENKIQQLLIQLKSFLENLNLQVIKSNFNSNKNSMVIQNSYQSLNQLTELSNDKPQFELYNYIKQDRCFSFAFSLDSSVLVVRQNRMIKLFEFKDGSLKETQQLTEHKEYVRCLYFMKKALQFVSGCNHNLIIIWSGDDKRHWYCDQILNRHTDYIKGGLIMNIKEDLIISGRDDLTIRFWIKQNNLWKLQKTLMVQMIPQEEEILHIYELDKLTHQFIKSKSIKIKSDDNRCDFFPQQFNKEKQILLHKNGRTINIIKIIDYLEFIPVQYIQNFDNYLYGAMTNDEQYQVTWDYQDKEIKIENTRNEQQIFNIIKISFRILFTKQIITTKVKHKIFHFLTQSYKQFFGYQQNRIAQQIYQFKLQFLKQY
ncbi:unnamed protein product [Paramecium pentaurelia]|uniref:WD40-repeat-containing domain n=1 Tax=Paramecium pentaurelia TaxID=43138 RepID=A0A8S1YD33_9CILI|nr:unnamed protein product [Paramecium pentaurelia]